jgi:opacity protein-like surface antigen
VPGFHPREEANPLKTEHVSFSVLLAVVLSVYSYGQDRLKHVTFDAGAGFSFPVGQLDNHAETGFNFVASAGARFNSRLSLGLDFALHYFNVENSLHSPVTGVNFGLGSMVRVWSLTVNPRYQFWKAEKFTTYATGGYGLYNRQLQIPAPGPATAVACDAFWNVCVGNSPSGASLSGNINPYRGGYNVGAGVNFGTRTKFFVETRYHHMFTTNSPTEIIPLTFGVRW